MFELLLIAWAVATVAAVFVLYLRDPYADGIHPPVIEPLTRKLKRKLASAREQLCTRGLLPCPS